MVDLALVRGAAAVPEKHPLQGDVAVQLVGKAKSVLLVEELEQVQQLGRGLDDRERRVLGVVDQRRDAAVRVEAQEPLLLLLVGHDVDQHRGPVDRRRAVGVGELLEHDLRGLSVGRVLRDQHEAFGRGDFQRRVGDVEVGARHGGPLVLIAV